MRIWYKRSGFRTMYVEGDILCCSRDMTKRNRASAYLVLAVALPKFGGSILTIRFRHQHTEPLGEVLDASRVGSERGKLLMESHPPTRSGKEYQV